MSDAIDLLDQQGDIQALVATGFSTLRKCRYLFLRVTDAAGARKWLAQCLETGLVKSVADVGGDDIAASASAMAIAFTCSGLDAIGLTEAADLPFPTVFKTGMADPVRAPLTDDNPAQWAWRDVDAGASGAVHLLVAVFYKEGTAPPPLVSDDALRALGIEHATRPVDTCPSYIEPGGGASYEPFGFRDGVSQPVIKGLRASASLDKKRKVAGALFEDHLIAPGEFLLGQINEYGETAVCPDAHWPAQRASATPFGMNGSYVVVRQYQQHVDTFRKAAPAPLGEKMVGRTQEGDSLMQCPHAPAEPNAYRYRVDDAVGFQCPRGAHARRANPRDLLGWDVASGVAASKLHRLLRRGRAWTNACKGAAEGTCGNAAHRNPDSPEARCGAGMVFIALNADLERQYEFIEQQWIMNRKFGDLLDEQDPILGKRRDGEPTRRFSIPAIPAGKALTDLEDFTKVLGGGYFFLPGMAALRYIALGPPAEQQARAATTSPEGAS